MSSAEKETIRPRPETVGVIDVGSNTIKLLIAKRGKDVPAEKVEFKVEEKRIGEGMTGKPPRIESETIERAADAIARLVEAAESACCDAICIVATAAVREATNKHEFVNAVEKRCGHELRILSGDEEAALIGLAIRCDPALAELQSYSLLDLGGGSLECIQILDRDVREAQSLPLGAVRLASHLLSDRSSPLSQHHANRIAMYVQESWTASKFKPRSSPSEIAVLTGGTASHLADSLSGPQRDSGISLREFREICRDLCRLPQDERISKYGIPASRADIFPTALVTLEQSLGYLGCDLIFFTAYNLRFGVASSLLSHATLVPPDKS